MKIALKHPLGAWERWFVWLRGGVVALIASAVFQTGTAATVRLNEILAANVSTNGLTDEDGDLVDWIELYNAGAVSVNLGGWSLTDDATEVDKWLLPTVTMGPGQYLIVFASGKDRRPTSGGNLHTNFKLNSSGEYLGLFNLSNVSAAVSELAPSYPAQRNDFSYGVDGLGNWVYFQTPTPGGSNGNTGIVQIVENVHFNVAGGLFNAPFCLVLSAATPGSTIRFTTDGSQPTAASGTVYTSPLTVNSTLFIRAAAFKTGALPSETGTRTYLFTTDPALLSLPILSIGIAPYDWLGKSGIIGIQGGVYDPIDCCFSSWRRTSPSDYFNPANSGLAWERAASLELLPGRGGKGFRLNAGVRVHGSESSRLTYHPDSKFSYTLFMRGDYGSGTLNYPLAPDSRVETFDSLVLRGGHNDTVAVGGPFITDELMRRLLADMGQMSSHGTFANVFINGVYKGYYNPTERIDKDWARYWLGGGDAWDVIGPYSVAQDGDAAEWESLLEYALGHDLTVTTNYQEIDRRLDLVNFADYLLLNIYGDTRDWTQNNWRAFRERTAGAKFRFTVWDAEFSLGLGGDPVTSNNITNSNELGNASTNLFSDNIEIALLFRKLKATREFKLLFADRVQKHFSSQGALSKAHIVEHFEGFRAVMAGVIPAMDTTIRDYWAPQRETNVMQQLFDAGLRSSVVAPSFNQNGGNVPPGFVLTMSAPAGQIYYTLDGSDPRIMFSGNVLPGARNYGSTGPVILNQSTIVRARVLIGSVWSALIEAQFQIATLGVPLRITEIMYNPPGGDAYEFIELQNLGSTTLDLGGMSFSGITYIFPAGSMIGPGSALVLGSASDPVSFAGRYPGVAVYGRFTGHLANSGERIALNDRNGETVTSVTYSPTGGWPVFASGGGYSLEIINPRGDPDDPANWQASATQGGSPGTVAVNHPQPRVRINEIMADNISAVAQGTNYPDWVELYNPSGAPVDLSGWSLSDDGNPRKFVFAAGTTLGAAQYLVIWCDSQTGDPGFHSGFSLAREGESIFLYDPLTNRVDAISYGLQIPNDSVGIVSGSWVLTVPTPGSANVAAQLGVPTSLAINEWLANSTIGADDWLELYNRDGVKPVSLQGLYLATSNAVFRISSLSFIAPRSQVRLWADENTGAGHLDFKLPAAGGMIILYDGTAVEIDRVNYDAQQEGVSQGLLPDGVKNIVSFPSPTPGMSNSVPAYTGPILNELMARNRTGAVDSLGRRAEWLELYNTNSSPFNLAGMMLSTDPGKANRWSFPAGVTVPAGGYLTVWCDVSRPASTLAEANLNSGLTLTGNGGGIYLFNPAGQLVDKVEFGFQVRDRSIGLSGGRWQLLAAPTFGSANAGPAALGAGANLRINEWLAKSTNGNDWFEVYNTSAQPVELSGCWLTDDPSIPGQSNSLLRALSFVEGVGWVRYFADGHPEKGPNHLNFSLDSDGDTLRLYDPSFVSLDNIYFGLQIPGVSQGRFPDGGANATSFTCPSPGEQNSLDSDGDGMPDAWETTHGLNPSNAGDALSDTDNDGVNNLREYLAGTDPRDANSFLKLDCARGLNQVVSVRFLAMPNRSYSVLYRDNVLAGPWLRLGDVEGQPDARPLKMIDTKAAESSMRVYRVVSPSLP